MAKVTKIIKMILKIAKMVKITVKGEINVSLINVC